MEDKPSFIVETPDFDSQNSLHVYLWTKAGKPDPEELDSDGNRWKPTITRHLLPDGSYSMPSAPGLKEQMRIDLRNSKRKREEIIDDLKADAATALLATGMPSSEVFEVGPELFSDYSSEIFAFIGSASKAFRDRVLGDSRLWLDREIPGGGTIRDVFLAALS